MFLAQAARTNIHSRMALVSGVRSAFRVVGSPRSPTLIRLRTTPQPQPHFTQTRPFLSWLLNPKEEPVVPKRLTPLKLEDTGNRLLFWDSTYTTPHLKPEFNDRSVSSLSTGTSHSCAVVDGNLHVWGSNYYSQVGLTTESFHDDDSEEITDVHFVNQLANEEIVQVASGNFHNLALSKTGKLWSWGSGCLGRGDEIYDSLPQPVEFFHALGRNIKQVFAAGNYSMALVTPKDGNDDELYIWGYIPFGEENEHGEVNPFMRKCLRPVLVTSVLGYHISHVACSPWHFTLAATPVPPSTSTSTDQSTITKEKPLLMTFGRYSDEMPLEKPYSPLFLDLPPEDEFYDVKPWRIFRSVAPTSDLVIKKLAASKGCDIVLMENGSVGVSDHEDHVARLIHRPLDDKILDVAGGSSEVIAISSKGQVLSWSEPSEGAEEDEPAAAVEDPESTTNTALDPRSPLTVEIANADIENAKRNKKISSDSKQQQQPSRLKSSSQLPPPPPAALKNAGLSALHPLLNFNKDEQKAETEVLAFFDSQRRGHEQKQKTVRLVEALFDPSRLVVEKPGLSKCVAQYDRFTIC
ncbi:RCC1/BLIP-II protein [Linnemannia elongata AG-77]|uniref:RCC1/BLIP-II protein n=1 Tax=Linnemannia elongata AG-77 TaxID=1314771 RepID=A0A197JMK2_9FUNG|nr:RCC1/BLIP-II protein [Linnemannia elongata AG-77]